ncbi:MAG TPA: hypothetical protein VMG58_08060 [Candidatus Sulfotelmatobacter sp.]|nr:hypothetical protein [Candidatus Sulfotelmatobacter sp.]
MGRSLDVCRAPVGPSARRREWGASRLGILVGLVLLAAGAYVLVELVPPYWTYLSLMDPVKEAAMVATRDEAKARESLLAKAREAGLNLEDDAVECRRDENSAIVRLSWSVPVDIPGYRRTLNFSIEKRSPLP